MESGITALPEIHMRSRRKQVPDINSFRMIDQKYREYFLERIIKTTRTKQIDSYYNTST